MRSIPPLFQLLPLILLWIILHFVFPIRMIFELPFNLIGLAPIIVGLFINIQATITLKRGRGRLVTEGAFQYSRNPIYLGGMVFFFGLAILLGSLVSFVFPAIMLLLVHFVYIPNEEKELKTMFGEEYLDYMKRVRKWI
jgi:protein-S-isoprenylcysteine O-methyltransferase Ste14